MTRNLQAFLVEIGAFGHSGGKGSSCSFFFVDSPVYSAVLIYFWVAFANCFFLTGRYETTFKD